MRATLTLTLTALSLLASIAFAGRDYYDLLGVPRDAHVSVIKKSYRRLARLYHPDKHPGDKKMETKFKDISKAYEVLADEQKRQQYDNFGEEGLEGGANAGGRGGFGHFQGGHEYHVDPSMFEDMFSGGFGGGFGDFGGFSGGFGRGGFHGGQRRQQRRQQQRQQYQQYQQPKICFQNKVCENDRCFMKRECN